MANRSSGNQGPGGNPNSIEPNPSPIAPLPSPLDPLPSPETAEELESQYDEPPSLLDEPKIAPECEKDLQEVIKDGMANCPRAAAMQKTAPDNFRYLYADAWENLPDDENRHTAAAAAVEEEIKKRE